MEVKLDTKCDKFLPRSENSGERIVVKQFNKTERKVFLNCMHPLYVKSKRVTNYRARLRTARNLFHPHHLDGDWKKKEHLLVIILWKRDSFGAKFSPESSSIELSSSSGVVAALLMSALSSQLSPASSAAAFSGFEVGGSTFENYR